MEIYDIPVELLRFINDELGNNLWAALSLGDINLLTPNIKWIRGLLLNYQYHLPDAGLQGYLRAYSRAAMNILDTRGKLIVEWFDTLFA